MTWLPRRERNGDGNYRTQAVMQHTRNRRVENLYIIFLELKKAYDRDRTMAILKGYGVGRNLLAFIKRIWDGDTKQAGFFRVPFDVRRGVRCGDIDSPIIVNIVVDAIIRDIVASRDHIILLPTTLLCRR
jgi:hypothetical protein